MELKNQKYQTLKSKALIDWTDTYNQSIPWYKKLVDKLVYVFSTNSKLLLHL